MSFGFLGTAKGALAHNAGGTKTTDCDLSAVHADEASLPGPLLFGLRFRFSPDVALGFSDADRSALSRGAASALLTRCGLRDVRVDEASLPSPFRRPFKFRFRPPDLHSFAPYGASKSALSCVAGGTRLTRCGLRAVRIGEASLPGPMPLRVWSHNVSSWHRHGLDLLEQASDANVQVLILQECNITAASLPSVSHTVQRQGWQMACVPKPGSRKGGVAVLVQRPLAVQVLQQSSSNQGQLLVTQLHGLQRSLRVLAAYRPPDADLSVLYQASEASCLLEGRPWVLGVDGNVNMHRGLWPESLQSDGAVLQAVARHNAGTVPIDGLWSSPCLSTIGASAELQAGGGDHSIAEAVFDTWCPQTMAEWRHAKTPKEAPSVDSFSPVPWTAVASCSARWQTALGSVDTAWLSWTSDIERWLRASQALANDKAERALGSAPCLRSGSHRVAGRQSVAERSLRRHIRRLKEAQLHCRRGRAPPQNLLRSLAQPRLPQPESLAIAEGRFGSALSLASDRLHVLLSLQHDAAVRKWRSDMQDTSKACKWLRRDEATPQVLELQDGTVVTQPAAAVEHLRQHWKSVFGQQGQTSADLHSFWSKYEGYLRAPRIPFPAHLQPIRSSNLRQAIQKMIHSVGGLDGISPRMLGLLPDAALDRLGEFLQVCEAHGAFPEAMCHWKVAFLPKARKTCFPRAGDTRPIAVGSAIYRLWSRLRLQELAAPLASCLEHNQAGGVKGHDAETLLCALDIEFDAAEYPFAVALDFQKAFDSLDSTISISVFQRLGLPAPVLNLLRFQWQKHRRWPCFAGAVSPQCLSDCLGLPQGDPFSPCALAVVLTLPMRHVQSITNASSLVYLDDRTLVARSLDDLLRAEQTWQELETCTRLRTHPDKTQWLARSYAALTEFQDAGIEARISAEVLGASVGINPRPPSETEHKRAAKAERVARRLALLPLSLKKKAALATMTFSAISAWGVLFGGRVPTQKESNSYRNAFRVAVKGCAQKFDRSSRDLQQLVLLGHHSDLAFLACQRLLKAMGRWTALLVAQGRNPLLFNVKDSALARGMNACLAAWSWTPKRRSWAEWGFGNRSWNLRSTQALQNRAAHQLREDWRLSRLREWLGHPTRIDSRLARASRVRASAELVAYLRRLAAKVDGHALSTMIGGLSTDARWCPAGPQRDHCAICLSHTTPSVEHVFWQCPFFDEIRCQQPPRSALARRLGWSFPTDESDAHVVARLLMLGNIRCAEVKHRQHRATWTVRGAEAAAWAAEAVG